MISQDIEMFPTSAGQTYEEYVDAVKAAPKEQGVWIQERGGFSIGTNAGANSVTYDIPKEWVAVKNARAYSAAGMRCYGTCYEVPDGMWEVMRHHDKPTSQYSSSMVSTPEIYHVLNGYQIYSKEQQQHMSKLLFLEENIKFYDEVQGLDEGEVFSLNDYGSVSKGQVVRIAVLPDGTEKTTRWLGVGMKGGVFGTERMAIGKPNGRYDVFYNGQKSILASRYELEKYI